MLGGIRDILIISTPHDTPAFQKLLGDGKRLGIDLNYEVQHKPGGIAEAFIYGRTFIGSDNVCLILGDNIFYGKLDFFHDALKATDAATIFAYSVQNPSAYGVVELDKSGKVLGIEEKPKLPKSDFAIPGLYVFPPDVVNKAQDLSPSSRGELEITDIHKLYLAENRLNVSMMGRGIAWLDTGTPENLIEAGTFIHAIEKRQGRKIACLEEIALEMGFITKDEFQKIVSELPNCSYKDYCLTVLKDSYQSGF
jgi:glucose-1-phosphate thymidylyltransferase